MRFDVMHHRSVKRFDIAQEVRGFLERLDNVDLNILGGLSDSFGDDSFG